MLQKKYPYTAFFSRPHLGGEIKYVANDLIIQPKNGDIIPAELSNLDCDSIYNFYLDTPINNFSNEDNIKCEDQACGSVNIKIKAFILKHNNRNFICNTADFCNSFAVLLFTFPSYTTIEMMEDKIVQFTIITHLFLALSNLTIILNYFNITKTNQREFAVAMRDTFYAQLLPRAIAIGILGTILVGAGLTQKQPGLKYEPARNLLEEISLHLTHGNFRLFYAHTFQEVINLFRNRRIINTLGEINAIRNYEIAYGFWENFQKSSWFSSNPYDCVGSFQDLQPGTQCGILIFYIWAMVTVGNEFIGLLGEKKILSEPYKGFGVYSHDTPTFLICLTGMVLSATILNPLQTSFRPWASSKLSRYCTWRLFPCCSEQEDHEEHKTDAELVNPLMNPEDSDEDTASDFSA